MQESYKRSSLSARNERGFTMLELLMVMVIVGTLAGLGISTYGGLGERRDIAQADVYWRDLNTAVVAHQMTSDGFPTDLSDLSEYLDLSVRPWTEVDDDDRVTDSDEPMAAGVSWALIDADDEDQRCIGIWVNGRPSTHNGPACPHMPE